MIGVIIGGAGAGLLGAVAYGDLRAKIGRLEGQMELISRDIKVIMYNNNTKK